MCYCQTWKGYPVRKNASKEDISKLAEEIRISEKSVIDILGARMDEVLKVSKEGLAVTKESAEEIKNT